LSPEQLSDWYELVEGSDLEQGDIFEGCPVFRSPDEIEWPLPDEVDGLDFSIETQDVIVMSQSCDLVAGQKSMAFAILCPMWPLAAMEDVDDHLRSAYGKEMCRRGNVHGFHMLGSCEHESWRRETAVTSFRELYNLPISFLRQLAESAGPRPRLRSPYREHLAQAFARYFMRVGLPVDIPPFGGDKHEERAIRYLEALDSEARKRVIDAIQD